MTNDEMQALRDFRAQIASPDDETRQRIYAYATASTRGSIGRRLGIWSHRSLPSSRPRLVAALAGAAIFAAAAALVATSAFSGGAAQSTKQAGGKGPTAPTSRGQGDYPVNAITVNYNRSGAALNSVDLTVNPSMADARIRLQVLHTAATSVIGTTPSSQVVFTEVVSATNTPPNSAASANGPSTWSGSLSPSDWVGGCQSGLYDIVAYAGGPGASLNGPNSAGAPNPGPALDGYHSGWFSCSGS